MKEATPSAEENPFSRSQHGSNALSHLGRGVFGLVTYSTLLCFVLFLWVIASNSFAVLFPAAFGQSGFGPEERIPWFNTGFLTKSPATLVSFEDERGQVHRMDILEFNAYREAHPDAAIRQEYRHSYSGGGILGPLIGTLLLAGGAFLLIFFLGMPSAIYLSEFEAENCRLARTLRFVISKMSCAPAITIALVGLGIFCFGFRLGFSLIAGMLTLAILILPSTIASWEAALRSVPLELRQGSLALGASRWRTLWSVVLPQALPSLLAVASLAVLRAVSALVPIMWTAALAHKNELPWQVDAKGMDAVSTFFSQPVQALPYHLYTVSTRIPKSEFAVEMQFGSAAVYLMLCFTLAGLAMYWKRRAMRLNEPYEQAGH